MEFRVFPGFWILLGAYVLVGWGLDLWAAEKLKDPLRGALMRFPPSDPTMYSDDGRRRAAVNRYYLIGGLVLVALLIIWNFAT
jgi:hypothetical protein